MNFIPRNLLFFLIGCALIGFLALPPVVSVGAQVLATITATQTFIPPSPTATGFVKSCPIGTPAGWGTYTPSPLWGLECGACASIQGTGTPTKTVTPWIGTGTPPIGCTPYPSGTGTPLAGCVVSTGTPQATNTSFPTFTPTPMGAGIIFSGSVGCGNYAGCSVTRTNNNRTIDVVMTGANNPYSQEIDLIIQDSLGRGSTQYAQIWVTGTITGGAGIGWTLRNTLPTVYSRTIEFYRSFSFWGASGATFFIDNGSYPNIWDVVGGTVHASLDQIVANTPTPLATLSPTPTATPYYDGGYCSTIAPPLSDFGFDLFVPSGVANCSLGWEAFTAGTIEVPAVKICFQPSEFGVIKLFGANYEIGIIALAAAAAFIWRFMRTV